MPPANVDLPHQGIDARFVILTAVFSEAGVLLLPLFMHLHYYQGILCKNWSKQHANGAILS